MGVEAAAGATTCSEFGRACDNEVTLSTTLICAPFTADHEARAADVPIVTTIRIELFIIRMERHTRCNLLEGAVLKHFNHVMCIPNINGCWLITYSLHTTLHPRST